MRKQIAMVAALVATTGLVAIVGAAAPEVTIKQAMQKGFGKKGVLPKIKTALQSDSPEWKAVQKETKVLADYSAAIVDATPKKGEKADFEKLAKALATNTKALHDAAEKEDAAGTKAAFGKIGTSCKACHDGHRGK